MCVFNLDFFLQILGVHVCSSPFSCSAYDVSGGESTSGSFQGTRMNTYENVSDISGMQFMYKLVQAITRFAAFSQTKLD